MDKISTANWDDYFGQAEPAMVHVSERYTETVLEFSEPALAAGKIRAVATSGYSESYLEGMPGWFQEPLINSLAKIAQWRGEDRELYQYFK